MIDFFYRIYFFIKIIKNNKKNIGPNREQLLKILQNNKIPKWMKSDAKIGPNVTKKWQKSRFYDYDADEYYPNLSLIPK